MEDDWNCCRLSGFISRNLISITFKLDLAVLSKLLYSSPGVPDLALLVHDVEPPEGHALSQVVAAEAPGHVTALVRHQGYLDFANPSLGP